MAEGDRISWVHRCVSQMWGRPSIPVALTQARPQALAPDKPENLQYKPKRREVREKERNPLKLDELQHVYDSNFLEMKAPQSTAQLQKSELHTYEKFREMQAHNVMKNGTCKIEVCLLNHYLVEHGVMTLYGYHDNNRKQNAIRSFSAHVTGRWCGLQGDIVVMPTIDRNAPDHLLVTLNDIEEGLHSILELEDNYREGFNAIICNDADIDAWEIESSLKVVKCLQLHRIFKPVFHSCAYEYKNIKHYNPQVPLTLDLLQKACLVFIKLCQHARFCQQPGSSVLLALLASHCDSLIRMILKRDDRGDEDLFFTQIFTKWLLANSYYEMWNRGDFSTTIKIQYQTNIANMQSIMHCLIQLKQDLPSSRHVVGLRELLEYPAGVGDCARRCAEIFESLPMPRSWVRSSYRMVLMTTVAQMDALSQTLVKMSDTSSSTTAFEFNDAIEQGVGKLKGVCRKVELDYNISELRDVLALSKVLIARYYKCRAAWRAINSGSGFNLLGERLLEPSATNDQYADLMEVESSLIDAMGAISERDLQHGPTRRAFFKFQYQMISEEVLIQLLLEDSMIGYNRGIAQLTMVLCFVSREVFLVKNNLTSLGENMQNVLAVYYLGVMHLYLLKYRKDSGNYKATWLSNAKYYSALLGQLLGFKGVDIVIINSLLDNLRSLRTFLSSKRADGEGGEDDPGRLVQDGLCVLKRAVCALPVLWELSIQRMPYTFEEPFMYDHVKVGNVVLPFNVDDLQNKISTEDCAILKAVLRVANGIKKTSPASYGDTSQQLNDAQIKEQEKLERMLNVLAGFSSVNSAGTKEDIDSLGTWVDRIMRVLFRCIPKHEDAEVRETIFNEAREFATDYVETIMSSIFKRSKSEKDYYTRNTATFAAFGVGISIMCCMFGVVGSQVCRNIRFNWPDTLKAWFTFLVHRCLLKEQEELQFKAWNNGISPSVTDIVYIFIKRTCVIRREFVLDGHHPVVRTVASSVIAMMKSIILTVEGDFDTRDTLLGNSLISLIMNFDQLPNDDTRITKTKELVAETARAIVVAIAVKFDDTKLINVTFSDQKDALVFDRGDAGNESHISRVFKERLQTTEGHRNGSVTPKGNGAGHPLFHDLEQFYEQDERHRSEQFTMAGIINQIFGDFYCNAHSTKFEDISKKISSIVKITLLAMISPLREILSRQQSLEIEGVTIGAADMDKLMEIVEVVDNEYVYAWYDLPEVLRSIDVLFFGGTMTLMLRGGSHDNAPVQPYQY